MFFKHRTLQAANRAPLGWNHKEDTLLALEHHLSLVKFAMYPLSVWNTSYGGFTRGRALLLLKPYVFGLHISVNGSRGLPYGTTATSTLVAREFLEVHCTGIVVCN